MPVANLLWSSFCARTHFLKSLLVLNWHDEEILIECESFCLPQCLQWRYCSWEIEPRSTILKEFQKAGTSWTFLEEEFWWLIFSILVIWVQFQLTIRRFTTRTVSNESPVSTFETGSRISVFQSRVRDGIENFFLPVSRFETRSRFSFFQSRASRRAREFFSFNLVLRDEHENFST